MSANVISGVPFGNAEAVRRAKAGNLAYKRAKDLGYSGREAFRLAKKTAAESNEWESPADTALRVVIPQKASFSGKNGV